MTYPTVTPTPELVLAVIDNGVRMPAYEAAPVSPPVPEVVETLPVPVTPPPPPIPVYPRKQDRN